MKLNSLEDLLFDKLNDIYDAETKTAGLLPKLAQACNSEEVKTALNEHIEQSKNQVTRLEQVYSLLKHKPRSKDNPIIDALIEKSTKYLHSTDDPNVKDAA